MREVFTDYERENYIVDPIDSHHQRVGLDEFAVTGREQVARRTGSRGGSAARKM